MSTPSKKCPICGKDVAARETNKAFPFCSPRCKTIDFAKWLDGDYGIPVVEDDGEPEDDEQGAGPRTVH